MLAEISIFLFAGEIKEEISKIYVEKWNDDDAAI